MSVYEYIPKDRFVSREELVRLTGLNDREVRREINALRKKPETVVISSSHGKGYKRPADIEELKLCILECRSRINDEMEKVDVMEKAMRLMRDVEKNGQLMFDFS